MQLEPIVNNRFKKFRESFELFNIADGEAFERFVNHAILSVHQPDAFSSDSELLETVCIGGVGDMGIDGIAIKINGVIVKSKEEIDDIIKKFKRVTVEFIFIQSKYKPFFNKGELNNFVDGVRDFLSDTHNFTMSDELKDWLELKEYLLSDEIVVSWENNPFVRLYYVAMGKWRGAPDLIGVSEHFKNDLAALHAYDVPEIHYVDSEALKNICDSIENNFSITFSARHVMPLTEVTGVDNSCIALVYGNEYIKLLSTEEGIIRQSLFEDNVRDFQGENSVNNEIEETIEFNPAKFVLLNNGITIVCDEFIQNITKLTLKNPQVVNGCQTSHVIFNAHKKQFDVSKVPLTIKIISTDNTELSNDIVRGTNRQNIVLEESFEATKKFHKELEQFFTALSSDYVKLYYERRSKQYAANPTIKQTEKINLRILTQYFIAMFLNEPHISGRHESMLLRQFANDIYKDQHSKLPYFTTAFAFYSLEKLIRDGKLKPTIAFSKPHLLMMFRESISGKTPNLNYETQTDEACFPILQFLKDAEKTRQRFIELSTLYDQKRKEWTDVLHKNLRSMKTVPDFTKLILEATKKKYSVHHDKVSDSETEIYFGVVKRVLTDKWGSRYGFIERKPDDIFFHSKQNKGLNFFQLPFKTVSYKIARNPKDNKLIATDVEIITGKQPLS